MISTSILGRITNMLLHATTFKRTSEQQLVGYKIKQEAIKLFNSLQRLLPQKSILCLVGMNSLHSSPYGTVFCICDQNSIDNTPIFQLLLNSACIATRPSLFSTLLFYSLPASRLKGKQKIVRGH